MNQMISEFLELAVYSVPSKHETEIRQCLLEKLLELGFSVSVDEAFPETHSGSLYGYLPGQLPGEPILFTAHMDTVAPCENKKITVEPDGTIHTVPPFWAAMILPAWWKFWMRSVRFRSRSCPTGILR